MTSTVPPSPPLAAAAEMALQRQGGRTALFEHAGERYVVKRLAEKPRRWLQTLFMRWLVKRLTGRPLPLRTLALSEAACSMDFEARRLRTLAAAGINVPPIALQTNDYLVLAYRGRVVADQLENWSPAIWNAELPRLARELGELHRAGLWHGGAQIKNLTLENGISTRIDFEENFGEFLPLAVTQATDLLLFLNSISLAGPIDEAETRRLLPELLAAYFAAYPDPAVVNVIAHILPLLRRLAAFAGLFQRWSRKGIRRLLILSDLLSDFIWNPAATPAITTRRNP